LAYELLKNHIIIAGLGMKIAIPLLKDRVAPYFGASSQILLVEIRNGSVHQQATWDVGTTTSLEMARRLLGLGVNKIICGGIDRFYKEWLIKKGIVVEDNRKGDVHEIIEKMVQK
jgi:predicted Fe-Mo cluster-binding NifX family protein